MDKMAHSLAVMVVLLSLATSLPSILEELEQRQPLFGGTLSHKLYDLLFDRAGGHVLV